MESKNTLKGRYKKSMSCRKVAMRHLPIIVSDGTVNEREKIRRSRIETLRDDSALCYNGYGFTLIELLVVVLIIGILAAVALPQYQKAVEKSHVMTLISAMKSIADAEESYYLANGEYTVDVETLSVDMPAGATGPTAENLYTLPNGQKISTNGMQLSQKTLYGGTSRIQIDWVLQHSNWPSFAPGIYCGADPTDSIGIQVCKSLGSNGQKANTVNVGCGIFTATPIYCDWYNISL